MKSNFVFCYFDQDICVLQSQERLAIPCVAFLYVA